MMTEARYAEQYTMPIPDLAGRWNFWLMVLDDVMTGSRPSCLAEVDAQVLQQQGHSDLWAAAKEEMTGRWADWQVWKAGQHGQSQ